MDKHIDTTCIDVDTLIRKMISITSRRGQRTLALCLLYMIDRYDYTLGIDEALSLYQEGFDLSMRTVSYAEEIARGVVEQRNDFSSALFPFLKNWRFDRLGIMTRLILYIALWEINQKTISHLVIINEAVELAKNFAEHDSYRFVNGILDEYCKITDLDTGEEKKECSQDYKGEEMYHYGASNHKEEICNMVK